MKAFNKLYVYICKDISILPLNRLFLKTIYLTDAIHSMYYINLVYEILIPNIIELYYVLRASLVAQRLKRLPPMREPRV